MHVGDSYGAASARDEQAVITGSEHFACRAAARPPSADGARLWRGRLTLLYADAFP